MKYKDFRLKNRYKVCISIILVMTLVLVSVLSSISMVMATSLPYIESLVQSDKTFRILEIVPEDSTGALGYYVNEQEPCSGWRSGLSGKTSPDMRDEYVNSLFGNLVSKSLLSDTDLTPLKLLYSNGKDYYDEKYIWNEHSGYEELQLNSMESASVIGTMEKAEGDGDYGIYYNYSLVTSGGAFIQNVEYFDYMSDTYSPEQSVGAGVYYYSPTFSALTIDEIAEGSAATNTAIYVKKNGHYKFYSMGYDPEKYYYEDHEYAYVSDMGAPSLTPMQPDKETITNNDETTSAAIDDETTGSAISAMNPYFAVPYEDEPFIAVPEGQTGYFNGSNDGYFYSGNGSDYKFTPGTGTGSVKISYDTVYYKAGYTNNNWLLKYVFDLSDQQIKNRMNVVGGFAIQINTVKASEVTAKMIENNDLFYLSAGYKADDSVIGGYNISMDLLPNVALAIYKKAAADSPIIIDRSLVTGMTPFTSNALSIEKLALLCLQDTIPTSVEETVFRDVNLGSSSFAWSIYNSDTDGTFINNNIYCFDDFSIFDLSGSVIESIATGDFNKPFDSTVYKNGFMEVIDEIENENFLRRLDDPSGKSDLPEEVTIANSIRYIINYASQRKVTKVTRVHVLELQPSRTTHSNTQSLSKQKVLDWIEGSGLTEGAVTITTMTTSEFIGHIEDINETYDLIYLGASTENLNTYGSETVYNDSTMNGLIYSHIGDLYYAHIGMAGLLDRDYVPRSNGTLGINGTVASKANLFRFSGNDITSSSAVAIKNFVKAGYPVVISDKLINVSEIKTNTGKTIFANHLDNSSYLYDAVNSTMTSANVFSEASAKSTALDGYVLKYLGVSKPKILFSEDSDGEAVMPVKYEDDTGSGRPSCMSADPDGNYCLRYRFKIENITDATPLTTSYDCGLYIDLNADGRYAEKEKLTDIEVYEFDSTGGRSRLFPDDNDAYALKAEKEYLVSRQLPTSMVGIIPWKLEVVKNGVEHIHASTHNYTRISGEAAKENISILQIIGDSDYLNLAAQLQTVSRNGDETLKGRDGKYYKGIYGKLISDLDDFEVSIDSIYADSLEWKGSKEVIYDYLNSYDMLIIGFMDMYKTVNHNSAQAIAQYIDDGKSVLFTHDTTSLTNVENPNGIRILKQAISSTNYKINKPWSTSPAYDPEILSVSQISESNNTQNFDISLGASPLEDVIITDDVLGYYTFSRQALGKVWKKGEWVTVDKGNRRYSDYQNGMEPKSINSNEAIGNGTGKVWNFNWGYWELENGIPVWKTGFVEDKNYITTTYSYYVNQWWGGYWDEYTETEYGYWKYTCDTSYSPWVKSSTWTEVNEDNGMAARYPRNSEDFSTALEAMGNYYGQRNSFGYWYVDEDELLCWGNGLREGENVVYRSYTEKQKISQNVMMTTTTQNRLNRGTYILSCDVTIPAGANSVTVYFDDTPRIVNSSNYDKTETVTITKDIREQGIKTIKIVTSTADTAVNISIDNLKVYKVETSEEISNEDMNFSELNAWGYYFNTVIRDKVGLDRFGITSSNTSGGSTYESILSSMNDGSNLTQQQVSDIIGSGRDVAYAPKSGRLQTVPEAQGYTNYSLLRYGGYENSYFNIDRRVTNTYSRTKGNYLGDSRETTKISQVNEGQITTYPYNINTESFGGEIGTGKYMEVSNTHEQYYQVNMNTDDIVVWYCLSNGDTSQNNYYDDSPNDVANSYYIYNKGNVTYSGVGHFVNDTLDLFDGSAKNQKYTNEAKLFVNTMIAAYQVGVQPPMVSVKDTAQGINDISIKYFTTENADSSGLILENSGSSKDTTKSIFFKVIDANMAEDKQMSVSYTYKAGDREAKDAADIVTRIAETGTIPSKIVGGVVYKADLSQSLLNELAKSEVQVITLYIKVTTTIDDVAREGNDSIELRKIGLFELE